MMYKRVPPVFSLEYLRVFLSAIDKEGYNRKAIRTAIFNERLKFEKEKFKAIGRGYRLKTVKSEHLVKNCYQLSNQIGLLQRINDEVLLADESRELTTYGITNPKTKWMLLDKLFKTYIPFNEVLLCIRNQPNCQVLLPLRKEKGLFKSFADKYPLRVNQIQFEVVRDLLTQLEVLNWGERKDAEKMQLVYLIATVVKLSEVQSFLGAASKIIHEENSQLNRFLKDIMTEGKPSLERMSTNDILKQAEDRGYIIIKPQETEDFLFIKTLGVSSPVFEEILWEEYLKISDYKSNYPVYYSELRDDVCERLRISDKMFDSFIKRMINKPSEYTVKLHPGGGPMPPRRGLSSMLKALPPKTGSDEYITFIKAIK